MKRYDVIIIGAGPSGCQCARILSTYGFKVLIVERFPSVQTNNFSSAGSPIEILKEYTLPDEIIGSYWNKISVVSTHISRVWESKHNLGVVLDFAKLRQFLIDEALANKADILFSHEFVKFTKENNQVIVTVRDIKRKRNSIFSCSVLVDATGAARSVMNYGKTVAQDYIYSLGLEYLINIDKDIYKKISKKLVFFLGRKWAPYGYSWIFPMEEGVVKVGYGILDIRKKEEKHIKLSKYIDLILREYLRVKRIKMIDRHGGLLRYRKGQNDEFFRDNVIAIGDSVSSINPLGGEGIRHGMYSATVASSVIRRYLTSEVQDFKDYKNEMMKYFGKKWRVSEWLSDTVYTKLSDRWIDRALSFSRFFSVYEILDLLFFYKFLLIIRGILRWSRWKVFSFFHI